MASHQRVGRLGFVPVRFGDDLVGGAEMLMREMADGLAERGWDVDILTGCTRDYFREVHHYAPGVTRRASGARLVRFPSVATWGRADRVLGNRALAAGTELTREAQQRWCDDDVRVPGLVDHLRAHGHEYRAVVFSPYLYWTTMAGIPVVPERAVLMPCLHDEAAARLDVCAAPFGAVRGVWFLTEPEAALARRLYPALRPGEVIGSGVDVPGAYDPDRFRTRFAIRDPFAVYVGRREPGKAFDGLIADFLDATEPGGPPLRLVIAGSGRVRLPRRAQGRVVDVGVLDARDRNDALAAAAAVIQPSPYESFSRTMMEAWLAGAYVVAHGESAVSAWHCARAGAGATYANARELGAALRRALDPSARDDGARGRAYVLREYTWPTVLDRVEAGIDAWFPLGAEGPTDRPREDSSAVIASPRASRPWSRTARLRAGAPTFARTLVDAIAGRLRRH